MSPTYGCPVVLVTRVGSFFFFSFKKRNGNITFLYAENSVGPGQLVSISLAIGIIQVQYELIMEVVQC
jgi:hypothetical protein